MTLRSEADLRRAYKSITSMYRLRDRLAQETTGHPTLREDEVAGIEAMIRKIERQIAEYLAAHPERTTTAA